MTIGVDLSDAVPVAIEYQPGRVLREAVLDDVPRLVKMGERFRESTTYAELLSSNPEQMAKTATQLIDSKTGVVWVTESNGELTGMIGLILYSHHLSGELTAGEVFWWVEPEARGDGIRLLKQAEAWAVGRGAESIQMIAPSTKVGLIYRRYGYEPIETAFYKRLIS